MLRNIQDKNHFMVFLKAFYFEIKNEWSKVKVELENIYESTNKYH